jgi:hypothetical protein
MKLSRFALGVVGWLLLGGLSRAQQDIWMPYVVGKQYSATETVTTWGRAPIETRVFVDGDKVRTEQPSPGGWKVIAIIRPDQQTVFWVILAKKMLLPLPFDPERIKQQVPPPTLDGAEPLGQQTIFGIACNKCRLTNASGRKFLLWTSAATGTPVKIMATDRTYLQVWTNYQAGPQDPALFEPPDDFQDVQMPLPPRLPAPLTLKPNPGK